MEPSACANPSQGMGRSYFLYAGLSIFILPDSGNSRNAERALKVFQVGEYPYYRLFLPKFTPIRKKEPTQKGFFPLLILPACQRFVGAPSGEPGFMATFNLAAFVQRGALGLLP